MFVIVGDVPVTLNAKIVEAATAGWNELDPADVDRLKATNLCTGCRLYGAYLHLEDLTGADLSSSNLTGADLGGANLRGATLGWAYLTGADLAGADLTGASLIHAHLAHANLFNANLTPCEPDFLCDLDRGKPDGGEPGRGGPVSRFAILFRGGPDRGEPDGREPFGGEPFGGEPYGGEPYGSGFHRDDPDRCDHAGRSGLRR